MPIIVDHLVHEYDTGSKDKVRALDDINLVIEDGEFVGLIGHTGSGKSTLVQHLDALLKPSSGTVYFNGEDIFEKGYELKRLRRKLGLVFQYPEHQLFEATVFDDVCFGPKNLGLDSKEVELRAFAALKQVGIEDSVFYTSPFDLSGGQKRRVAIAGVLAMKPEVLVLDEPTAGLDPEGRTEILSMVKKLHDEGLTIILVSHSMEDVADYVDRIIAMDKGKILLDGDVRSVFAQVDVLEEVGLGAPAVNYVMRDLKKAGFNVRSDVTDIEEAKAEILKEFGMQ